MTEKLLIVHAVFYLVTMSVLIFLNRKSYKRDLDCLLEIEKLNQRIDKVRSGFEFTLLKTGIKNVEDSNGTK